MARAVRSIACSTTDAMRLEPTTSPVRTGLDSSETTMVDARVRSARAAAFATAAAAAAARA